jgi:hypothetical protein
LTASRARRALAVAVVAASTVIAACSGDDDGARPGEPTTPDTESVETTSTAPPQLERRDAGFALPVTLVAGDVLFELTRTEFSNATPGTYSEDEPDLLADELLYVTFTAQVDPAAGSDVAYAWLPKNFQIVTGSGRVVSGSGVDYATTVDATSAEPTTAAVVFPVKPDEVSSARFRFDDGTSGPVEVALAPPPPPETAPPPSEG